MEFESIKNEPIVQKIIGIISNYILEKKLKAKDKIPNEYELAKQLNVSRNSVREALKILDAFGVLEIKRGDGTYISDGNNSSSLEALSYSLIMGDSPKEDIVNLRIMLDLGIYFILMQKITDKDVILLENRLEEEKQFINSKEFTEEKYADLDIEFHLTISNLTKNKLIEKIYDTIMRMFRSSIIRAVKTVGASKSIDKHKEIIDIFKKKDIGSVLEVINKSLEMWQDYV